VTPNEVGIGQRANFVVSVPTEEDVPTTHVRLVIPQGLQSVTPNVKPGWDIELVKSGEGEETTITEIIWSGGSIPAEQRDEFVFRAQAPAEETILVWKAYQTYEGGKVVAWENSAEAVEEYTKNNPTEEGGHASEDAPKPYSETNVVNDLEESSTTQGSSNEIVKGASNTTTLLSIAALILAAVALGMQFYNKSKTR
jgi:uncharacterized protein YcnI